jgi:hypothetical protein
VVDDRLARLGAVGRSVGEPRRARGRDRQALQVVTFESVEQAVLRIAKEQEESAVQLSHIAVADTQALATQRRTLMYIQSHEVDRNREELFGGRRFAGWHPK